MIGNYKTIKAAVECAALAAGSDRFPNIEIHAAEGGGVELRATDGYRMHVVTVPDSVVTLGAGDYLPARVHGGNLVKAIKGCKGASEIELTAAADTVTVSGAGAFFTVDCGSVATLPDPSKVLGGDYSAPETVQFNAEYLAEVGKAATLITNPKAVAALVFEGTQGGEANKPSRWSFANPATGVSLSAYLMPVRRA